MKPDEIEIVEQAKMGNAGALALLRDIYRDRMYFAALAFVKDESEAETISAAAWIKAVAGLKNLPDDEDYERYLAVIVCEESLSHIVLKLRQGRRAQEPSYHMLS